MSTSPDIEQFQHLAQSPSEVLWVRVRNPDSPLEERSAALSQLVAREDPGLPPFLSGELAARASSEWLAEVLFAIEQTPPCGPYPEAVHRAVLFLLGTGEARWEPAVWSGIRILGSRCRLDSSVRFDDQWGWMAFGPRFLSPFFPFQPFPSDTPLALLPYLRGPFGEIDTRQVTLQALAEVCATRPIWAEESGEASNGPFAVWATFREVAAEPVLRILATELLTAEPPIPGKSSSLVMNALIALAALSEPLLVGYTRRATAWQQPWLIRQLRERLGTLKASWVEKGTLPPDHPIIPALEILQSAPLTSAR